MVTQFRSMLNYECDCDSGCYDQIQATESMQCEPFYARVLRRSTPPKVFDASLHTGCRTVQSTRGIRRSTQRRMLDGPMHQRYQTIHSTPDFGRIVPHKALDVNVKF
ncbi:hypothetical protein DPMN_134802 [Dreissena polymorpha]|uniref:Uncharacterized protein n=1 Tax=Dreissena polymorpha TaxID=45954 RepID=A0A9D4JG58_DREPO|nr:hypothetical protein DPMN_134802 [Dreissena polymorpha]